MEANKITAAIIGMGFIGKEHLECTLRNTDISVVAIVDANEENGKKIAEKAHCSWFASIEDLFNSVKPDYVDICLPSTLHEKAAVYAMEHGANVLMEKPFALSLKEIDSMISTAESTNKRIMVAHVCRFMPQYRFIKELVSNKKYGEVVSLTLFRESSTPDWSWNNWLHDKKTSGGTIMDLSIHDIDVANWILGDPKSCYAHEITNSEKLGVSEVLSILEYAEGCAKVTANHLMPKDYPFTAGYKLLFNDVSVEWQTVNGKAGAVTVFENNNKAEVVMREYYPSMDENPYYEEIHAFAKCLKEEKDFPISVNDARLAVKTVLDLVDSL